MTERLVATDWRLCWLFAGGSWVQLFQGGQQLTEGVAPVGGHNPVTHLQREQPACTSAAMLLWRRFR
jgi:hypothetical protein